MSSALQTSKAKPTRDRLDKILVARGYAQSRERAQAMILAGQVRVEGRPAAKAGQSLPSDAEIELEGTGPQYASRGGLKLKHALDVFSIQPAGWTAMDVGASTGGFTDCLLQYGVKRVYAVDVGYGQLAWRLRQDPRVVVIERTNIRHMAEDALPEKADLITADLSFISLRLVLPKFLEFLKPAGKMVVLVKPQFEVGKGQVGRGGIVKDKAKHLEVLAMVSQAAVKAGLTIEGSTASPLPGRKGNQEYFIYLTGPAGRRAPTGNINILDPSGKCNKPDGVIKVPG